jgi:hypothetical protein
MFEQVAMGCQRFGCSTVAKPAPKVKLNPVLGIFAKALKAFRLIAPGSAAGQKSHLSIAGCCGATPQAFNRFLITTKRSVQNGVGIH